MLHALALTLALCLPHAAGSCPPIDPASPRSETAPLDPHLVALAERAEVRAFLIEVRDAYALVGMVEQVRADARAQQAQARAARSVPQPEAPAPRASAPSSGRCGGDLPPCYVMERESGGDLRAENPVSTASGKWQFLDSTWDGYGGYAHASDAPESVQDARAAELWAGGAGCSHWSAC